MSKRNSHIGSDFDDFLTEEGILQEVELVAVKRIIAHQIEQELRDKKVTKKVMAEKMHTSRASLNRLLDPENLGITLQTLGKAANALGMRLHVSLEK
ncbi:hypothetical protein Selin_2289 [Desulfurispirillum indicum S5]|uniref:HTH cro/C1-type domain-containing protein n=1 Tax=Desulfurispirillum indicum (strain ATCC BAA-1389 / DSM 22839 / S5) TaxID=653733 RepID=E6W442_DESIS|nr:helix-turn-helix domain-containing protein [Desulfurispirillum indicum]ADU67006.1 hypothetical protein Selin_2289 [Desulfurispirillum indicum S5]